VADHRWQDVLPSATRQKVIAGKVPAIIHDERPAYSAGDRVILGWGRSQDPELGTTIEYPEVWLTVRKVSADGARWITAYSPPAPRAAYLRRGSGYTTDPFLSADPQVEAEHVEVTPEARAKNTIYAERQRINANLRSHLLRYEKGSARTRSILKPVILACKTKLESLDERQEG
jgi:hypothetical protein